MEAEQFAPVILNSSRQPTFRRTRRRGKTHRASNTTLPFSLTCGKTSAKPTTSPPIILRRSLNCWRNSSNNNRSRDTPVLGATQKAAEAYAPHLTSSVTLHAFCVRINRQYEKPTKSGMDPAPIGSSETPPPCHEPSVCSSYSEVQNSEAPRFDQPRKTLKTRKQGHHDRAQAQRTRWNLPLQFRVSLSH